MEENVSMSRIYKISELIMNNEKLYYTYEEELKKYKKLYKDLYNDPERITKLIDKRMKQYIHVLFFCQRLVKFLFCLFIYICGSDIIYIGDNNVRYFGNY